MSLREREMRMKWKVINTMGRCQMERKKEANESARDETFRRNELSVVIDFV
jgi:hypothetical protein